MSDKIVRLEVTPGRRWISAAVLTLIGTSLIYFSISSPPATAFGRFALPALGILVLWQVFIALRSTAQSLILTDEGIQIEGGELLFSLDNVVNVPRGILALKPSNGFSVTLKRPVKWRWAPGLYWCVGRHVGIGGSVSSAQAKYMADTLVVMLAERHG